MIKKYSVLLLVILGCQNDWLDSEENDFKARCNNPDLSIYDTDKLPVKVSSEDRIIFCDCILNELKLSNLSYDNFLKQNLEKLDAQAENSFLGQISKTCFLE
tara:strand:- start:897 stop:1202 length:306 start_codon:yes stop_codon:yes gene_type:complete